MATEESNVNTLPHTTPSPSLFKVKRAIGDGLEFPSKADLHARRRRNSLSSQPLQDDRPFSSRRSGSGRPQLPSFKGLGIASFDPLSPQGSSFLSRSSRAPDQPHLDLSPSSTRITPLRSGSTPLLTPPEDLDPFKWAVNNATTPQLFSKLKPFTNAGSLLQSSAHTVPSASLSGAGPPAGRLPLNSSEAGQGQAQQQMANTSTEQSPFETRGSSSWLDQSVGAAVMSIDPSNPSSSSIQIVSQTLPSPAKESARPNAIFTEVISAIQSRFQATRQPYITITHAVPSRFDLLNLPSSPPSTPNIFVGRDDYFSQSIFAHAAVVPSYHMVNSSLATSAPSSPNPIVPPSSVQISVLERYIPPPSQRECRELFSMSGQSVLIDRLAELSSSKGSMLFVYPTRPGAHTFLSKYLSPILDPLLRTLVEVHQLSYSLAESLSSMNAVSELPGFSTLKAQLTSLCHRMSHRSTPDTPRSNFDLVYASTGQVVVDRKTWTDWYLKQEQPRFKRILETYWGQGRRLSQLESATAGTVLREFIDGVDKMSNEEADQPGAGIEVAVFIIRRTLESSSS